MYIFFLLFFSFFIYQPLNTNPQKEKNPRYVAGLINLKHLHGFASQPSNSEWQEYKAIERNCWIMDSWLIHFLADIYILISQDKRWESEYFQELLDCKEFEKVMSQLKKKYSK